MATIEEGYTRTGRPEEVLEELRRSIAAMISRADVRLFYIGRSVNVEQRTLQHGADTARCVYESTSSVSAREVEDDLIKFFYEDTKCVNVTDDSRGNVGDGKRHVYVAFKKGKSRSRY